MQHECFIASVLFVRGVVCAAVVVAVAVFCLLVRAIHLTQTSFNIKGRICKIREVGNGNESKAKLMA